MAARKTAIEFLPQEEWEKGALGKILKWALRGGRHIVIFTELIVILAFISRFKLDRDLTNLGEEVKQKQAIVQASWQFEKEFRLFNNRLQEIESLEEKRGAELVLEKIAGFLPQDVYLNDITISGKEVYINAISLSEGGIANFLEGLGSLHLFKDLVLSQVVFEPGKEIGIKFQIKGNLGGANKNDF